MSALLPGVAMTACRPVPPEIATPFGALTFRTVLDGRELPAMPQRAFRLPAGGTVSRWARGSVEVETVLTRFDTQPIYDIEVTDCWGLVWRVSTRTALPGVVLEATLPPLPPGADGGWDGGQCLFAVTVDEPGTRLTIGTGDEEALCHAAGGGGVPGRWEALIKQVYRNSHAGWGVELLADRGLRWRLPPLEAGEHCELYVAACWRPVSPADEDDCTTWFAVAASPSLILRQALDPSAA